MNNQSEPTENLSQSHFQGQTPSPLVFAEVISPTCDAAHNQNPDIFEADEAVQTQRDALPTQKPDLYVTHEAMLERCSGSPQTQNLGFTETHEAALNELDDLQNQNLDIVEANEENSSLHARIPNAGLIVIHEEIPTAWDDIQTRNLIVTKANEELSTELRSTDIDPAETPQDIQTESDTQLTGKVDLVKMVKAISSDRDRLRTQNSNLLKKIEGVSSELDTLRNQNLLLIKSHEEVSTHFKSLQLQNINLINTLEQICQERDTLRVQNLNLSASLEQTCIQCDNLQSNLHNLEKEIRSLLDERSEKTHVFLEGVRSLTSVKECLRRIVHRIDEGKTENSIEKEDQHPLTSEEEPKGLLSKVSSIYKLAMALESHVMEQEESRSKRTQILSKSFDLLPAVKECLVRITVGVDKEKTRNCVEEDELVTDILDIGEDSGKVFLEIVDIYKLAMAAESGITEQVEMARREMEELLEQKRKRTQVYTNCFNSLRSVKECLGRLIQRVNDEKTNNQIEADERMLSEGLDLDEDSRRALVEISDIHKLVIIAEASIMKHCETRWKEMKELEERSRTMQVLFTSFDSLQSTQGCLKRIIKRFEEVDVENPTRKHGQVGERLDLDERSDVLLEITGIHKLAMAAEAHITEHDEIRKKEIRELENSVVSLTEENRDISSLLKIALAEKEAVEKRLSRPKGSGEQRRLPILQIVQKVGLTFMMGSSGATSTSDPSDIPTITSGTKSDGSECEEEVVSLASTVEKIMKNLRLEISQLKRSLEESRSDGERLQSLTEKQAQKIEESTLYIKDLEERETMLTHNVEDLMMELAEAEEEIVRWREACELEVEAAKAAVEERDKEVAILKEELEKTKALLEESNYKLKLKEELAAAAMAAQAAAERSLQLVDSRSAGFRERIEELTMQLEEADSKGERAARRKVRHVCWPWRALRINPAAARRRDVTRRRLPEMEALLHQNN